MPKRKERSSSISDHVLQWREHVFNPYECAAKRVRISTTEVEAESNDIMELDIADSIESDEEMLFESNSHTYSTQPSDFTPELSPTKEDITMVRTLPQSAFDSHSYLTSTTSLAVAREGLYIQPEKKTIASLNSFLLGSFGKAFHIYVYVSNVDESWLNEIFLPSVQRHYSSIPDKIAFEDPGFYLHPYKLDEVWLNIIQSNAKLWVVYKGSSIKISTNQDQFLLTKVRPSDELQDKIDMRYLGDDDIRIED